MSLIYADVSEHNSISHMRNVDGVMIRSSWGHFTKDAKVAKHVSLAESAGIPYGFYHYSYALNVAQAKEEVNGMINLIKQYKPTLPIAIDMEDADGYKARNGNPSKQVLTDICEEFCYQLEKAGYYAMIYANLSWWKNKLIQSQLTKYDRWLAQWGVSEPSLKCGIWQFTSAGRVNGFNGNVDLSESYHDYASIIKEQGLNNYKKTGNSTTGQTPKTFKVGDTVRITKNIDYNDTKLDSWVLNATFEIIEISGNRIVIGRNGAVTAAMDKVNLKLA